MSQNLHQQLVDIRSQAKAWLSGEHASRFSASSGICVNIKLDPDDFTVLCNLMQRWPAGSGDRAYPVPLKGFKAEDAYRFSTPMQKWNPEHKYARNRWALLEWLIEQTASEADQ